MNATRLTEIKQFAEAEEPEPWNYANDSTCRRDGILELISEIERLQTVAKMLLEGCKCASAEFTLLDEMQLNPTSQTTLCAMKFLNTCIRKGEEGR
jgi:hypothetical protein